ncbi:TPA: tyrosine-type recombinase/integrase [Photobacterium damselae]
MVIPTNLNSPYLPRKTAYLRNIEQVQLLHALLDKAITTSLNFATFKAELSNAINLLRQAYKHQPETQTHAPLLSARVNKRQTKIGIDEQTLHDFVQTKQLEGVIQLTIKQLNQRCSDFLNYTKAQGVDKPSNAIAMNYRDELLKRGLSHKTIKDYLAANKQFFNWCVAHERISANPFNVVKMPNKSNASPQDERLRWKLADLKRLFSSDAYRKQSVQFKWITLIMLYHGCRPSEACQLQVRDIEQGTLPCIKFTDSGDVQRIKNASSKRMIPVHPKLLELGFMEYVERRIKTKQRHLFDLTPRGDDKDWSKDYRDTFGDVLDTIGFKAGKRATAYSFRHIFIDELKCANVEEHLVSQIVGHKHHTMTYGRYGKLLELEQLAEALNCFDLEDVGVMLSV